MSLQVLWTLFEISMDRIGRGALFSLRSLGEELLHGFVVQAPSQSFQKSLVKEYIP